MFVLQEQACDSTLPNGTQPLTPELVRFRQAVRERMETAITRAQLDFDNLNLRRDMGPVRAAPNNLLYRLQTLAPELAQAFGDRLQAAARSSAAGVAGSDAADPFEGNPWQHGQDQDADSPLGQALARLASGYGVRTGGGPGGAGSSGSTRRTRDGASQAGSPGSTMRTGAGGSGSPGSTMRTRGGVATGAGGSGSPGSTMRTGAAGSGGSDSLRLRRPDLADLRDDLHRLLFGQPSGGGTAAWRRLQAYFGCPGGGGPGGTGVPGGGGGPGGTATPGAGGSANGGTGGGRNGAAVCQPVDYPAAVLTGTVSTPVVIPDLLSRPLTPTVDPKILPPAKSLTAPASTGNPCLDVQRGLALQSQLSPAMLWKCTSLGYFKTGLRATDLAVVQLAAQNALTALPDADVPPFDAASMGMTGVGDDSLRFNRCTLLWLLLAGTAAGLLHAASKRTSGERVG